MASGHGPTELCFIETTFSAVQKEGRDISDPSVIVSCAVSSGIGKEEAWDLLHSDRYSDDVRREFADSTAKWGDDVAVMVISNRYCVLPYFYEDVRNAIRMAASRQKSDMVLIEMEKREVAERVAAQCSNMSCSNKAGGSRIRDDILCTAGRMGVNMMATWRRSRPYES